MPGHGQFNTGVLQVLDAPIQHLVIPNTMASLIKYTMRLAFTKNTNVMPATTITVKIVITMYSTIRISIVVDQIYI